ncbi:HDOD domain-containing protein [Sulfurivermis fontis]|uniref:HDOD domain-containing protein n=1 Tax=Sulfurivermis fontis TaxID=1972068 RepID=UPI000FD8E89F|nr:HDOD domain-containing protein [Sulfurivermis fontis]
MRRHNRIEPYLSAQGIPYRLLPHAPTRTLIEAALSAKVDYRLMVRAVMLEDEHGMLMAVLPASHMLDFARLCQQLGRKLHPLPQERLAGIFTDCEPGSVPPLPQPYNLPAIIDEQIPRMPRVCFEPGDHQTLALLAGADFMRLHAQSRRLAIARPAASLAGHSEFEFVSNEPLPALQGLHPGGDLQQRITTLSSLPPLPQSTQRLLRLRNNPRGTIAELADIVATDPLLAAQVIRYARSAYYGYRGRVESLHDAITQVLGFDMVLHMALGLSASRALRLPADGPLGQRAFWRHSVYTAGLAQALNTLLPPATRGKPGLVYLAGLLHDVGFAVLGHLFQPEFYLLNKAVATNPHIPVTLLEKRLLGVEHTQLGGWLLEGWDMPEEVSVAAREHHNETYGGEHTTYANLVLAADHLLRGHQPSDAAGDKVPPAVLTALGLDLRRVTEVTDKVLEESRPGLDEMAGIMAA